MPSVNKYRLNPDNVIIENRNALVRRIKMGSIPKASTLSKYNLTLDIINNIRRSVNLEPLTEMPYELPSISPNVQLSIAKSKRLKQIEDEKAKQIELLKSINKKHDAINNKIDELGNDISNIDIDKLTTSDIITYYDNINMNKQTLRGIRNRLKVVFHDILKCDINENIIPCIVDTKNILKIKQHKSRKGKTKGQPVSTGTVKSYIQVILQALTVYPGLKDKVGDTIFDFWHKEFQASKLEAQVESIEKQEESVIPFSKIKEKIIKKYGLYSMESLIINLYDAVLARDDFADLFIVEDVNNDGDHPEQNYIVWNGNIKTHMFLILKQYKTVNKYGVRKFKLPLINSVIANKLGKKPGDYLITKEDDLRFGDSGKSDGIGITPSLSRQVNKILKGVDIDGSINYLRHAKISEELSNRKLNKEDRLKLSAQAMHSPNMSTNYLRKLKIEDSK